VRKALTIDPGYEAAKEFEKAVLTGAPAAPPKEEEAEWEEVKE
jgi:hypothetical protein